MGAMVRTGLGTSSFRFGIDLTPMVRKLLIITVAVWLVQLGFSFAKSSLFEDLFALDPRTALPWRPWQLVSYMFLHSVPGQGGRFDPLHIFFNMLMLVLFGGQVERAMGSRKFLRYYLVCGVAGAVLTLLPPFNAVTVGASGAVLGVLTAFGLLFPDEPILLLVVFVPAKIVVLLMALLTLFSAASATAGGISHIAHLGGMAAGYLMLRGVPFTGRLTRGMKRRNAERESRRRLEVKHQMDEILDKMNREGRESLSQKDWRTLLEESKRRRDE
jgi:membrane associated rhomboid family serine protease